MHALITHIVHLQVCVCADVLIAAYLLFWRQIDIDLDSKSSISREKALCALYVGKEGNSCERERKSKFELLALWR